MHRISEALVAVCVPLAGLTGQAVLTVGPTGQYPDLPQAVAAAQAGDVVRCLQTPPFQLLTAPVIDKALTLDGGGSNLLVGQLEIRNLAPTERVTVQDFVSVDPFDVYVHDCAGRVHFDRMATTTNAPTVYANPSFMIERSQAVSMLFVNTHGSPAIAVTDSVLAIGHCKLGSRAGGNQAGGVTVDGLRSIVTITQPEADPGNQPIAAMQFDQCDVTITGRWGVGGTGSITAGGANGTYGPAIAGINSTLTLAPGVAVTGAITGFAAPLMREVPYHRVLADDPGGVAGLETYGPANAIGVAALTAPALPTPSPLGLLWIDAVGAPIYSFQLDYSGRHYLNVAVPAAMPIGAAFTLQGAVLSSWGIELTLPETFVIPN